MKKKLDLTGILSMIHLVFVLSVVCFGTIYITLGVMALPALTAAFTVGKDVIYGQYDVYDRLIVRFYRELKANLGTMRYFPLQLMILLQTVGIYAAEKTGMAYLTYPLLACIAFIAALLVYIITYHVFYKRYPTVTDALIAMFYKIQYFLLIWVVMILASIFVSPLMLGILLVAGTILLLTVEIVAFLDIVSYKKARSELSEFELSHLNKDILSKL